MELAHLWRATLSSRKAHETTCLAFHLTDLLVAKGRSLVVRVDAASCGIFVSLPPSECGSKQSSTESDAGQPSAATTIGRR